MKTYPIKKVNLGNETIAYRKAGNGEKKLVAIHGNMSSSAHLNLLMEALEDDYEVFAPDMRGFGQSSYEHSFDSLHELAEDLLAFTDEIGLSNYEVLGWSTGGGVAMVMAAKRPQAVKRVILVESVGLTGYPMFKKDESFQAILDEPLMTKEDIAKDPIQVAPVLLALEEGNKDFYRMLWNQAIYNNGNQPDEDLYDYYLEDMLTQKNLVDVDYALTRFNISEGENLYGKGTGEVKKIVCPVEIIQGENDLVVPLSMAQEIKDALGDQAKLHLLKSCGHSPFIDAFDQVVQIIRR